MLKFGDQVKCIDPVLAIFQNMDNIYDVRKSYVEFGIEYIDLKQIGIYPARAFEKVNTNLADIPEQYRNIMIKHVRKMVDDHYDQIKASIDADNPENVVSFAYKIVACRDMIEDLLLA